MQRGRLLNALLDHVTHGPSNDVGDGRAGDLSTDLREYAALARSLRGGVTTLAALIAEGWLTGADDPRYPARLGTYPVERVLGHGGVGIVLLGFDPVLKRNCTTRR